jgi:hypothetical protein
MADICRLYILNLALNFPGLKNTSFFRLLLALALYCTPGLSQNQNKKWFFGALAGLDFMTTPPTILTGGMNTIEGCASIADAAGNTLFYTDGANVYNSY